MLKFEDFIANWQRWPLQFEHFAVGDSAADQWQRIRQMQQAFLDHIELLSEKTLPAAQQTSPQHQAFYQALLAYFRLLKAHWQHCLDRSELSSTAPWRDWIALCEQDYQRMLKTVRYQRAYARVINLWLQS